MNLLKKLTEAWKETKEDLMQKSKRFREMEENSSYYENKQLRNEEFITMILMPPIYYLSNLFRKKVIRN